MAHLPTIECTQKKKKVWWLKQTLLEESSTIFLTETAPATGFSDTPVCMKIATVWKPAT